MELLEYHFSNLSGNLYHDENNNTFEMFSNTGEKMHLNYLTFRELFKQINNRKDLVILESGIASAGTNSTYLFNEYIKKYGGQFWSVDINKNLGSNLGGSIITITGNNLINTNNVIIGNSTQISNTQGIPGIFTAQNAACFVAAQAEL